MHRQKPAAEADQHEEPDLHPVHGHAHGAGAVALAADGEDPVADLGAQKHPGCERDEDQPVDDGDADLRPADHEIGGENRFERIEARHPADVLGRHIAGDQLGDGDVETLKHQEGAEGDEEAVQLGPDQEPAVQRANSRAKRTARRRRPPKGCRRPGSRTSRRRARRSSPRRRPKGRTPRRSSGARRRPPVCRWSRTDRGPW